MFLPGLVLLVCVWSPVEPACDPVEEGQPTNLTCNVNTAGCNRSRKVLEWGAETSTIVVLCSTDKCVGVYGPKYVSATISPTISTLTINRVSRTVPFDMGTKWSCRLCRPIPTVTVCDKLQVYAKPTSPSCAVTETPGSGEIMSVTVTCSTDKVYPAARCRFYTIKNGGQRVQITQTPNYETPTPTSTTPVYYNSECSVSVSVQELGEGTHSFQGFIYPDVTGGQSLVTGITPAKTVTLSFPEASHSCTTNTVQGYFIGKSATCTCSITPDGNPRGTAQWYRGDNPVGTAGTLDVSYDRNNAEQTYTCEAESILGRKVGSTLIVKFAFLDLDSVQLEPPSSPIKLCDDKPKTAQVTCRISKENVSPALSFSFSRDGLTFEDSKPGTESSDGVYYQRQFSFSQDVGGEYQVYCRVVNTILNTYRLGDTRVTFQKPPPGPAQVTVDSRSYQGTALSNIVTLIEGYTGDVTCHVEGGYPNVTNTHLKCGQRNITGDRNTATLSFTDNPLRRDMDGKECSCTIQHVTGCYSNRDTKLTLDVLWPPEGFFTKDPAATIFNRGDVVRLLCFAQGNPDPSLTLTRERTGEILANVLKGPLTHALVVLDCQDIGVYVCSGQNSLGTNSMNISINVRCPQQFNPTFDKQSILDAVVGDNAQIDLEIYGFPEPSLMYLRKTTENGNIILSPRHTIKYTAGDVPFGVVTVIIFDIVKADFTNYTLTVDNGVGEALIYKFYLNEVQAKQNEDNTGNGTNDKSGGDSLNIPAIIIGVIALVILVTLVVIILFLMRRIRDMKKEKVKDTDLYLVPIHTPDIVNNVQTPEIPRPGQYEEIDGVQNTTGSTHISTGLTPGSRQDRDTNDTLPTTHTAIVSASQPPERDHYETVPDTTPTSGPYNSTSPQDAEPPNIYSRAKPETSSTRHDTSSGDYNNFPGHHGATPDSHISSPSAGAAKTSLPNRSYSNVLPSLTRTNLNKQTGKQAYQNVDLN